MKITPCKSEAYNLLHEGCIALSQVETNGIKIDTDYLRKAIKRTTSQINELTKNLKHYKIYKTWRKHFGSKTNLASREQLGKILFDVMKYKCHSYTDKEHRPKADETSLRATKLKFADEYLRLEKLKKAKGTYLKGILRETTNGFLHPNFPLHLVQTYRGSSSDPNFHNIPIKIEEIKKLIRQAFISRTNHRIIEIDFKGAEVSNATCYHKDPNMIKYIKNPKRDMHRDAACECLMLKKNQVSWDARDIGKNMFIFPQFYGDYYIHCAKNMWEAIIKRNIRTTDGLNLIKHLKRNGIIELGNCNPEEKPEQGTFEKHVQRVEYNFWNKKFKVYNQWKKDWYNQYLKKGYFKTLTGFIIEGVLSRNQVINYPVQGSSFHWLLWSLIRIQKLMNKYKMKSLIVGQIHDSIVGDIHKREEKDYLKIVKQVIYEDIRKHWNWIIVPLIVEAGICPINGSWYEKEEIKLQ
jgi:DNA polymerase I-like protein with 3'-5' exonuclease and polymerase domains